MKVEISKKVSEEVLCVYINSHVRYWEDSKVNGIYDDPTYPKMPFVEWDDIKGEYRWKPIIDPDGTISEWPSDITADINYKVCDEFECLVDLECTQMEYEGYVPRFMSPEEENFGDYITMHISSDGKIRGWNENLFKKFIEKESIEQCKRD